MKKMLPYLFIFLSAILPQILLAQSKQVSGTVKDALGVAISNATIHQVGTNIGITANDDGTFIITTSGSNVQLEVSAVGFETKRVSVSGTRVDVVLERSSSDMEKVVVTAFGIKKQKRSLGYSTQEVDSKDLMLGQQSNLVNALQGKVAGVQINAGGGAPGQGATILIRGIKSLDPGKSNQPLFIIDGVIMDNSSNVAGNNAELRGMSNRASDINPDDVENISVLKGGAATALYGQAGSNGVVVITTKSAMVGKIKVGLTSSYGIDKVNKLPEVQMKYTQGNRYTYDSTSFWPTLGPTIENAKKIDPSHPDKLYNHYGQGYEQGNQFRTTLNVSGGTEVARLSSSISFFDQKGMMPFSDYKNFSVRLGGQFKPSSKLSIRPSLFYINSGGRRVNANRYNESLSYWTPRWNVMDYITPQGTMKSYGTQNNPVYLNYAAPFKDNVDRILGDLSFTYSPFSFLDLDYKLGMDNYNDFRNNTAAGPLGIPFEKRHGDMGLGFVSEYNIRNRIINSNIMATFKKDWLKNDKLSTVLRVGNDVRDQYYKRVNAEGSELDVPTLLTLNNTKVRSATESISKYRIVSAYGEFTTGFDNMIFFTVTGRNDWSSALTKGLNSFFYPSFSLSAILSDMIKMPSWFSYAKLRGSVAEIGKDTDPYRNNTYYGSYVLSSTSQVLWTRSNSSGDPKLKPERTKTLELGTELRFIKDRLGLDFTWYKLNSRDQIIPVNISPATGFTSLITNAGEIENKGIEVSLNGSIIRQTDFSWDIDLNYTANKNKVVSIREDLKEIVVGSLSGYLGSTVTMKYVPGRPAGDLYGTSYLRYYGNVQDDKLTINKDLPLAIGTAGAGAGFPIRDLTQRVIGNSTPKWIGGLNNTFRYKNLSLSFLFDAQQGFMKYNQLGNFMAAFSIAKYTENREEFKVFDGTRTDGTANTQSVYMGQGKASDGRDYGDGYYRLVYRGVSENFVEDASWVRLRTLRLGYTIPSKVFGKSFIDNATISFTGNNLWLSTKYSGFDPESTPFNSDSNTSFGFAGFTYPAAKTYMFTLNVNFK